MIPVDSFDGAVGELRSIPFTCVDINSDPVTSLLLADFTINPTLPSGWPPVTFSSNTIVFQRNGTPCTDTLSLVSNGDSTYVLNYTPSTVGNDYIGIYIASLGATTIGIPFVNQAIISTNVTGSAITYIDQDYPTTGALTVPGPNQSSYTVFVYTYANWSLGNTDTLYAINSTAINTDGSWVDQIGVPSSVMYTVVAISTNNTVVLNIAVST